MRDDVLSTKIGDLAYKTTSEGIQKETEQKKNIKHCVVCTTCRPGIVLFF